MNKQQLTATELALYYAAECVVITDCNYDRQKTGVYRSTVRRSMVYAERGDTVRPILRRMEDMTEGEVEQWLIEYYPDWVDHFSEREDDVIKAVEAARTKYLLSIGIDLFGWIDAGLAVDQKALDE